LPLKGKDVQHIGIATHYTESDNLLELEKALLLHTNNVNQIESVLKKHCVVSSHDFSLEKNMDQINKCFSVDTVEEIFENLEKDGSDWANETSQVCAET
jgi:3-hydroxyisobutyryl-CoA hydrolase